MEAFLREAWPACRMLDEKTAQVAERLWFRQCVPSEFAAAFQRFQILIEDIERGVDVDKLQHTDFDMVLVAEPQLGPCHVVHARKIMPPGTQQFRNETAQLVRCGCGAYRVETTNPLVQRCC